MPPTQSVRYFLYKCVLPLTPTEGRLDIFPNSYAATKNRTQVRSAIPPRGTLIRNALPTKLHGRGDRAAMFEM